MGRYEGETGFDVPETEADMVSVKEGSRALVAETVAPDNDTVTMKRAVRSDAAFVTQLIATARGVPQTRAARRAAPAEAATAYGAAPMPRVSRAGLSRLS